MADVAFVLDTTAAPENLAAMKDYIKKSTKEMDVFPAGVQIGVITSGPTAAIVWPFSGDPDKVDAAVQSIVQQSGTPRMDLALQLANQKLFTSVNGARKEATKVGSVAATRSLFSAGFPVCSSSIVFVVRVIVWFVQPIVLLTNRTRSYESCWMTY